MTRFIIVADVRTGSTLLSASLNRHPQIKCYGELFHAQVFADNVPAGCERTKLSGSALIEHTFASSLGAAVGFRAMTFLPGPEQPQWADSWDYLTQLPMLRVIYLVRENRLAQYASLLIAQQTGVFHPYDNDPLLRVEQRPQIEVEPHAFQAWVAERDRLMEQRRAQLAQHAALDMGYEQLTQAWEPTLNSVQDFLGVKLHSVEQAKKKQERRPLASVIENYAQVAAFDQP